MVGQRESRDGNVRRVEWHIKHEREIRDAVTEAKTSSGGHTGGAPSGHTYISDPTAIQAIRAADELRVVDIEGGGRVEWPERWLTVIDAIKRWCGTDTIRAEIFKRRFRGESYVVTCDDLHIGQSTHSAIMAEIRGYEVQCACQAQLVKVF